MLVALAERMAERRVLVTFNGKSFDWPLLETRYHMTRKIRLPCAARASRFSAPGAQSVAAAAGLGAAAGAGKARAGMESRRGRDVRADPADLFRFSSRRLPRSAGPDLPSQPDGPARAGGTGGRVLAVLGDPERTGRTRWSCSACRASANGEANRRARGRFMSGRSRPELPPETERAAQRSLARLAKREGDHSTGLRALGEDARRLARRI